MSDLAINEKGDAVMFDGNAWVPAPIAANAKGERMAFDGAAWRPIPAAPKSRLEIAKDALLAPLSAVNTGVNWAGTQFTKGLTGMAGLPRMISDNNQAVSEWAGEKLGAPEVGKKVGEVMRWVNPIPGGNFGPTSEDMNNVVFGGGPQTVPGRRPARGFGVPEVNAGDQPALTIAKPFGTDAKINVGSMLDAGMQAIPGMIAGPASTTATLSSGARAATTAIPAFTGGAASEAAGQATHGTFYEIPARLLGGVLGFMGGNKAVTPLPAHLTPEQARTVELAKEMNIPLTVGQETGRGRAIESALARFPTSAGQMAAAGDRQAIGVNKAALAEMKAPGDIERLDPQSMRRAVTKASSEFEAAKTNSGDVKLGTEFYRDLNKTLTTYLDNTPAAAQVPSVTRRATDFLNAPGRQLTGEQYQEFRRTISEAAQAVPDVGARRALQGMRAALDDAMEASLPAEQAAAWREVRKNWSTLKILTKAAAGGTVDSRSAGNLSPSALTGALRQSQGVDRFATTEGGLNDVARVSGYLADTRPNSGTPQTLAMQSMLTGGPLAAGYAAGGPLGAGMAGGALLAPNLLARAMTGSTGAGWLRDYLANQAAPAAYPQLYARGGAPFALAPGGLSALPQLERRQ